MRKMTNWLVALGLVVGVTLSSAQAGIVWVDPDDYALGAQITPPFVTLSAVLGSTSQNPPDGRVLALADDKGHYPDTIHFFGWHIKPSADADQVAWRGKWANLQAVFDSPVSYVAMDFYRNDFYGGQYPDEIGFVLAFDELNNLIHTEWVYLEQFVDSVTVEIARLNPEIKKIVAGGVYVTKSKNNNQSIDQDILIRRLGYSIEAVPEPGTMVLLVTGGIVVGTLTRFGRKRNLG